MYLLPTLERAPRGAMIQIFALSPFIKEIPESPGKQEENTSLECEAVPWFPTIAESSFGASGGSVESNVKTQTADGVRFRTTEPFSLISPLPGGTTSTTKWSPRDNPDSQRRSTITFQPTQPAGRMCFLGRNFSRKSTHFNEFESPRFSLLLHPPCF